MFDEATGQCQLTDFLLFFLIIHTMIVCIDLSAGGWPYILIAEAELQGAVTMDG